MLLITKQTNSRYEVSLKSSGKILGYYLLNADGYYYYCNDPTNLRGWWSQDTLYALAEGLKALNAELDEHLTNYFNNEKTTDVSAL
jgi:hypothetical protein